MGRRATNTEQKALCPILKDLDFMKTHGLILGPQREAFLKQIQLDALFLQDLNIMDYSLLVGIYCVEHDTDKNKQHKKKKRKQTKGYGWRDEQVSVRPIDFLLDEQMLRFAAEFGEKENNIAKESVEKTQKEKDKSDLKKVSESKNKKTTENKNKKTTESKDKKTTESKDQKTTAQVAAPKSGNVDTMQENNQPIDDHGKDNNDGKDTKNKESQESQRSNKAKKDAIQKKQTGTGTNDEKKKKQSITTTDVKSKSTVKPTLEIGSGIRSWSTNRNSPTGDEVYFMGIIDILTRYNTKKKLEHFFKGFKHKRSRISCVNARSYARRFCEYLKDNSS